MTLPERRKRVFVRVERGRTRVVERRQPICAQVLNGDRLPRNEHVSGGLLADLGQHIAGQLLSGVPPAHLLTLPGRRALAGVERKLLPYNGFTRPTVDNLEFLYLRRKLLPRHSDSPHSLTLHPSIFALINSTSDSYRSRSCRPTRSVASSRGFPLNTLAPSLARSATLGRSDPLKASSTVWIRQVTP